MRNRNLLYLVEGDDEKKLVNTLKNSTGLIHPGKVQKLNVIECNITDLHLRTLAKGTIVVLIFDTDTDTVALLDKNIEKLKSCSAISAVVTIPQVPNLEGELVRSCNIKVITELLNSKSTKEYKSDLIRVSNLDQKLKEHQFDINIFWSKNPKPPYHLIENQATVIKQPKK